MLRTAVTALALWSVALQSVQAETSYPINVIENLSIILVTLLVAWFIFPPAKRSMEVSELKSAIVTLTLALADTNRILSETKDELLLAKSSIALLQARIDLNTAVTEKSAGVSWPLLLVTGPDARITDTDLSALRQSGIKFKRLLDATPADVRDELDRRRRAGDLFKIVHVATHMNCSEIELEGAAANIEFWRSVLYGVEGLFLAGCDNIAIADGVLGIVKWVISTREDIGVNDRNSWAFIKVFYTHYVRGESSRDAYNAACKAVPDYGELTDYREQE
jgi:hypothetical protein